MDSYSPTSILVVDDLQENLDIIGKILQAEGFTIRTARSGDEALEAIERERPELVLLDIMMPGIDGIEVCRRIKGREDYGFIPVVLLTAHSAGDVKRRGLQAGAEDFVSKPFDRDELVARIRSLLRTKRLYDDLSRSHARIERDVEALGLLQRRLLPQSAPKLDALSVQDYYLPSRKAGGDYFDFFRIDDRRIGIAVADVAGHGPPAAVLMAIAKVTLHDLPELWTQPGALLEEVGRRLLRFITEGEFITMVYGVLDSETGEFTLASAGHCPPIRFGDGAPRTIEVQSGLPLGLVEDHHLAETRVQLSPGERLLLYTDGLIEVEGPDESFLGMERFMKLVEAHRDEPAEEFRDHIIEDVRSFAGDAPFRDDCTLLVLEWSGDGKHPRGSTPLAADRVKA